MVGGSLGARVLNDVIWNNLGLLTARYQIAHMVGAGNRRADIETSGYRQFEYLGDEYGDVLAAADLVISRAGANSLFELLTFRKPHLLVPLTALASRGDQLVNARIMAEAGMSLVIQESELTSETLMTALASLADTASWQAAMADFPDSDAVSLIVSLIEKTASL